MRNVLNVIVFKGKDPRLRILFNESIVLAREIESISRVAH